MSQPDFSVDPMQVVGTAVVDFATVAGSGVPMHYSEGAVFINGANVFVPAQTVELPSGGSTTILMPDGSIHVQAGFVADQPGQIALDTFTVIDTSLSKVGSAKVGTAVVVGVAGWWPRGSIGGVSSQNLQANSVTSGAIASKAVETGAIADAAIGNVQLGTAAVENGNVASQAIGAGQLLGLSSSALAAAVADPATQSILYALMNQGVQQGVGSVGQTKNAIFDAGSTSGVTPSNGIPVQVGSTGGLNLPAGGTWTAFAIFVAGVFDSGEINVSNGGGMTTLANTSGFSSIAGQSAAPSTMMITSAAGGATITFNFFYESNNPGVADVSAGAFFVMAFRSGL
jgi:hypothetical protein